MLIYFPVIVQRASDDMPPNENMIPGSRKQMRVHSRIKLRRPADCSAGLLEENLCLVCSVATVMMAAVKCELPVRLGVAFVETLAIVITDEAAIREGGEFAMRDCVRPPLGQSFIEALPLFDQLQAIVYMTV